MKEEAAIEGDFGETMTEESVQNATSSNQGRDSAKKKSCCFGRLLVRCRIWRSEDKRKNRSFAEVIY